MIYDDSIQDSQIDFDMANQSFYELLFQQATVENLIGPGKQPLVGSLSKHFKLMFIDRDNLDVQRSHLVNSLYR